MDAVVNTIQLVGDWVGTTFQSFANFVTSQPYIFAAFGIAAVGIGVGFLIKILKAV